MGKKIRLRIQLFHVLLLVTYLLHTECFADVVPPPAPTPTTPAGLPKLKPISTAALDAITAASFSECNNYSAHMRTVQTVIVDAVKNSRGISNLPSCPSIGSFSLEYPCPPSVADVQDVSKVACKDIDNDPKLVGRLLDQLKGPYCADKCIDQKTQLFAQEQKCIQAMAVNFNQLFADVANDIQKHTAAIRKYVQEQDRQVNDKKAQAKDIEQRLEGTKGQPGLLDAQKNMDDLLQKMPAEISALKGEYQSYLKDEKALTERVALRKLAVIGECLSKTPASTNAAVSYTCEINGPPVTPLEYLKCHYQQQYRRDARGRIEYDAAMLAANSKRSKAMDSAILRIESMLPTNTTFSDTDKGSTPDRASSPLRSMDDLIRIFNSELSGMKLNNSNLTASQFINEWVDRCNKSVAAPAIAAEEASQSGPIGEYKLKLNNKLLAINAEIKKSSQNYVSQLMGVEKALIGKASRIDLSGCAGSDTLKKINCLSTIQASADRINRGDGKITYKIPVLGSRKDTDQHVECGSLKECTATLSNKKIELTSDHQKITTAKNEVILAANAELELFLHDPRISQVAKLIQDKVNRLSQASVNAKGKALEKKYIQGEPLTPSENPDGSPGLVNFPSDIKAAFSEKMTPPLMDTLAMSFDLGSSSHQDRSAKIAAAYETLAGKTNSCQVEATQKAVAAAVSYAAANCSREILCKNRADELLRSFSQLSGTPGLDTSSFAALSTGIENACAKESEPKIPSESNSYFWVKNPNPISGEEYEYKKGADGKDILIGGKKQPVIDIAKFTRAQARYEREEELFRKNKPKNCQSFLATLLSTKKAVQDFNRSSKNRSSANSANGG